MPTPPFCFPNNTKGELAMPRTGYVITIVGFRPDPNKSKGMQVKIGTLIIASSEPISEEELAKNYEIYGRENLPESEGWIMAEVCVHRIEEKSILDMGYVKP